MKNIIELFDQYLTERALRFQAVIIGGAALIVMSLINRLTKDFEKFNHRNW